MNRKDAIALNYKAGEMVLLVERALNPRNVGLINLLPREHQLIQELRTKRQEIAEILSDNCPAT